MVPKQASILLIDDNPAEYPLLRAYLSEIEGRSFDVTWIADYREALGALRRGQFDVCFLDYRLGERDGVQLLSEAGLGPDAPPVVLLTGLDDPDIDVQATAAGAADYLSKSHLNAAVLERTIRHALERSRSRKALQRQVGLLRMLQTVTALGLEGGPVPGALRSSLEQICTQTGWAAGHVLRGDSGGTWTEDEIQFPAGRSGDGGPWFPELVSRAVAVRRPVWKSDGAQATAFGECLTSAVTFPIVVEGAVELVVEVACASEREEDPELCDVLERVGSVLGREIERRRREEALRENEARFRAMAEGAPLGIFLLDAKGESVYFNPRLQELADVTLAEAQRGAWEAAVHPDDREWLLEEWYTSVAENRPFEATHRYRSKKGEIRWVEVRSGAIRDGATHFGQVGMVLEITERRRAEELNLAFQKLGQRLNHTTSPEAAGRVVLAVADELLGWDACWLDLFHRDLKSSRTIIMVDTIDGKRTDVEPHSAEHPIGLLACRALEHGPFLHLVDDGPDLTAGSHAFGDVGRLSAAILCVPIHIGARPIGVLSIQSYTPAAYRAADLNTLQALADYCGGALERTYAEEARHQLEEQLRQAQKMEAIGQLAGGIAHDFNNMLGVINGYSDLILQTVRPEGIVRTALQEISRAGDRAAGLTRQLLAFGRRQMVAPRVLCLNDIVADASTMLRRLIGEDIDLAPDLDPYLGLVCADPSQVEQVLMNLIVNARDAMPHGGRISIQTENLEVGEAMMLRIPDLEPGPYAVLTVSDTGCGMPRSILDRIFEPFFTTKEVGRGTGLGLATVYGIVKQNGGHVVVESEVGTGTTFRIYFPRSGTSAATVDRAPEPASPDEPATILVVEDEKMVRDLVESILRSRGYQVLTAGSGEDAIRAARSHHGAIQLLLTDVVMPGGVGGGELAAQIRNLEPGIRVLFMSGYADDAIVRRGVLRAESAFIQKPFAPEILVAKVRSLLHGDP